jgi:hypothetical protein
MKKKRPAYSIASDTFWDLNKLLAKLDTADLARLGLALKADPELALECVNNHLKCIEREKCINTSVNHSPKPK